MAFKGHATGLHALLGGGVIVSPGCTFELLARFNAANQGYANGQVLDTLAEGVNDGQLTVVEVDGTLAIVGNECAFTAQGTPIWGDLGFWGEMDGGGALSRSLGKGILVTDYTVDAQQSMIGCYDTGVSPMILANSQHILQFRGTGPDFLLRTSNNTVNTDALGDWVASTPYDVAFILGGYTNAGVPWDDTQAAASYLYGVAVFIKGGAYTNWTLLWRETADNTASFYPAFINYSSAGNLDDFRVPTTDYSTVLQPAVKDTFTDANGTSLDAHTPDVIPSGGWTEQFGNYDIQGNRANVVNDGGVVPRATATVTGLADRFARVTINLAGGTDIGGHIYRYTDNNNWWDFIAAAPNQIRIIEYNGGVATVRVFAAAAILAATDYELTSITSGSQLTGFFDGGNRITFTSVFNQTETLMGFRASGAGSQLDNFHFHSISGYTELDECP